MRPFVPRNDSGLGVGCKTHPVMQPKIVAALRENRPRHLGSVRDDVQ